MILIWSIYIIYSHKLNMSFDLPVYRIFHFCSTGCTWPWLWVCGCPCSLLADRPVTYLYNTLHYYEGHLRDRTNLKRKLVHAIIGSLKDNRPLGWCLSDTYLKCAMNAQEDNPWIPDDIYYCKLIARLVDNILFKKGSVGKISENHWETCLDCSWMCCDAF